MEDLIPVHANFLFQSNPKQPVTLDNDTDDVPVSFEYAKNLQVGDKVELWINPNDEDYKPFFWLKDNLTYNTPYSKLAGHTYLVKNRTWFVGHASYKEYNLLIIHLEWEESHLKD